MLNTRARLHAQMWLVIIRIAPSNGTRRWEFWEWERKEDARIQCLWSCSFVFFHVSVRIFSSCLLRLKSHTKKFLADALILQAGSSSVGRHCVAKAELHGLLPHQRRRRRAKRSVNFFKGDLKIRQKGTFLTTTLYVSLPPPFNRLIDKFDAPQLKKPIRR